MEQKHESKINEQSFLHNLWVRSSAYATSARVRFFLPTRRAAEEFRRLSDYKKVDAWEDFMLRQAAKQMGLLAEGQDYKPQTAELIMCLYEAIRQQLKNVSEEWQILCGEAIAADVQDIIHTPGEQGVGFLYALLKDFIQLDAALLDVADVLDNLASIKFLEFIHTSVPDEAHLRHQPASVQRWVLLFRILPAVYDCFQQQCQQRGLAHTGQLWRAWSLHALDWFSQIGDEYWIVAGLNSLSRAEVSILRQLYQAGKLLCFWDSDIYYHEPDEQRLRLNQTDWHPVGKRLKTFCQQIGVDASAALLCRHSLAHGKKEIFSIGVPSASAQAWCVSSILQQEGSFRALGLQQEETVGVVLVDTFLLPAFLHALPHEQVSFFMGTPIKSTDAYHFLQTLFQLHMGEQLRMSDAPATQSSVSLDSIDASSGLFPCYFHTDVFAVLNHPYAFVLLNHMLEIQGNATADDTHQTQSAQALIHSMRNALVARGYAYISYYELRNIAEQLCLKEQLPAEVANIFQSFVGWLFERWRPLKAKVLERASSMLERLLQAIEKLEGLWQPSEKKLQLIHVEQLMQVLVEVRRVLEKVMPESADLSLSFIRAIFQQMTRSEFVYAEQRCEQARVVLMGLSEARLMDFKQLIVVSVNEGFLPEEGQDTSLLPLDLRQQLGLPLPQEHVLKTTQDFYQLLHHAERIVLLHVQDEESVPSRYIYQLADELAVYNPNICFRRARMELSAVSGSLDPVDLRIAKSPEIIRKTLDYLTSPERGLSPSALNDYLSCSLRFYFSRVLGLAQGETIQEDLEDNEFGTLLHRLLEWLFGHYRRQVLDAQELEKWLRPTATVDQDGLEKGMPVLERKIEELLNRQGKRLEGSNYFAAVVLRSLLEQFLLLQIQEIQSFGNIIITDLEVALEYDRINKKDNRIGLPLHLEGVGDVEVKIRGTIDRIDCRWHGATSVRPGTDKPADGQPPVYCVIDYKSGKVKAERLQFEINPENIRRLFRPAYTSQDEAQASEAKYSLQVDANKVRQLLIYAYLYRQYLRQQKSKAKANPLLKVGIYSFRNLQEGLILLSSGPSQNHQVQQAVEWDKALGQALKELAEHMLSKENYFEKTPDIEACTYCPYKVMCQRQ